MGNVRSHLLAQLIGLCQFRAHRVEGATELPYFIPGTNLYLLVQISFAHFLDGTGQIPQGRCQPPGEEDPQQNGQGGSTRRANQ